MIEANFYDWWLDLAHYLFRVPYMKFPNIVFVKILQR